MKNKVAIVCLALAIVGCAAKKPITPQPPSAADHTITFTWNQSFANNAACSTTVTASCISGFNEGYLSGSTQVQLHTDTPAVCTGSTEPKTCTSIFNGVLPIGAVTFYVTTAYLDSTGKAAVTTAATSSPVTVIADAASNVIVTVQ